MTIPATCHPRPLGCFSTTCPGWLQCTLLLLQLLCSSLPWIWNQWKSSTLTKLEASLSTACCSHTKTTWSKMPIPTPVELSCLWLKQLLGPGIDFLRAIAQAQPHHACPEGAGAAQGTTCTLEGICLQECSDPSPANRASAEHSQHAECQASSGPGTPASCSLGGGGTS